MRRTASEIIRSLEQRIARLERKSSFNPSKLKKDKSARLEKQVDIRFAKLKGIENRGETRYLIKRPSRNMNVYMKDQIVSFLESIDKEEKIENLEVYGMEITLVHNDDDEYVYLEVKSGRDTYIRHLEDTEPSDVRYRFEFTEHALLSHLEDEYQSFRGWEIK